MDDGKRGLSGQETCYCYEMNYDGGKAMRGETKWVGMDSLDIGRGDNAILGHHGRTNRYNQYTTTMFIRAQITVYLNT